MNKKIDEKNRQIIELFRQGKSYKQIANKVLHCNKATIYARIKKMIDAEIIDETVINERKNNIAYLKSEINEQIIELFRQGKTYEQIAEVLRCKETTIYARIKKMIDAGIIDEIIINERKNNIAYLKQKKLSETNEQIIKLLKQGKTISEIAHTLNFTTTYIYHKIKILHEAGKLSQDIIEQNPTLAYLKKITIDNTQLKELFKQGKPYREIAEVFNCSESHILRKINILKQSGEINKEILAERKKNKKQSINNLTIQIIELHKKGYSQRQIESMLHCSRTFISHKIKKAKASGILNSKEEPSNNQTEKTLFSNYIKKANLISSLNSNYEHSFFSEAFKQAKSINDLGKLTQEDVDILAKALLIELPTLENVINISRLYVNIKQYQKCIMFLEQSREFFNEEQKSKINELLLEIKTTIKNNQKKQNRNRQIERN